MLSLINSFAISFIVLIIAMSVHEFAHALVAYKLGDSTAKYSGRLTLNPLAHIDVFWTVILPFVLFISSGGRFVFGAAKPVPINYWSLKNPKRDIILIGLSGPVANFILAFLISLIIRWYIPPGIITNILVRLIIINVVLGVFNLIPIPPLDGSRILMGILPDKLAEKYALMEQYAFIVIILFIWLGIIDLIIWPITGLILKIMGIYL